jgi:hypothetical protein
LRRPGLAFARGPRGKGIDVADDRLSAFREVDMLNRHFLLAVASVALERLDLSREVRVSFDQRVRDPIALPVKANPSRLVFECQIARKAANPQRL